MVNSKQPDRDAAGQGARSSAAVETGDDEFWQVCSSDAVLSSEKLHFKRFPRILENLDNSKSKGTIQKG